MTGKQKSSKKRDPKKIYVNAKHGDDESEVIARNVLRPSVQAAVTLKAYDNSFGDIDLSSLINSLVEQSEASIDGDLNRAEAMLTAQAHTLDAIFNNLAQRAITAEYMGNLDIYLKLALRAQSQSRATWEALMAIKYPPIAGYVGQANIANGPQQVNNSSTTSRVRGKQNPQNEQLEHKDGERLDTRTTGKAGKADPAMATVGEIDRSAD